MVAVVPDAARCELRILRFSVTEGEQTGQMGLQTGAQRRLFHSVYSLHVCSEGCRYSPRALYAGSWLEESEESSTRSVVLVFLFIKIGMTTNCFFHQLAK